MAAEEEYITVKYKASTIRGQGRFRLFVLLPFYVIVIVVSAVIFKSLFLALIGTIGLGFTIWRYFYWHKLLR